MFNRTHSTLRVDCQIEKKVLIKKKWTILVQSNLETDSIKFDPVYAKPSKKKTTKKLGNNPVLWINWTPTEGGLVWPLALPLGRGRFLGLSFIGGRRFLWFISLARPGECVFFYFFFLLFFFFFFAFVFLISFSFLLSFFLFGFSWNVLKTAFNFGKYPIKQQWMPFKTNQNPWTLFTIYRYPLKPSKTQ